MPDVLFFNGRFTTTDEPVISVEDRGFQFGDAVYETIKFHSRDLLFGEDHFRRLEAGLGQLEIPNPWTRSSFRATMGDLLRRTEFDSGIVYLQISRGVSQRSHFPRGEITPTVVAYSRRFSFPDEVKKSAGIRVITTEETRWKHREIKSVNLLGNVLAKKKAQEAGVDEALFVEDGCVIEGASSNFFAVLGELILTRPSDCNILPGVVRNRVIELARRNGLQVEERAISHVTLESASEAFITSTTQGVMPVTCADGRPVGTGKRGVVTRMVQELFDSLEAQESARSVRSAG
jgi:D-alanine transaminase